MLLELFGVDHRMQRARLHELWTNDPGNFGAAEKLRGLACRGLAQWLWRIHRED
jgi:hypothetical protein